MHSAVEISVVIPTRDRAAALERCLQALTPTAGEGLEVVVSDDGSRDAAAVHAALEAWPGARLVDAGGRGPAAARNAGARAARGRVICFIDDDCEPASGWAQQLAGAAEALGAPVAGRTRNAVAAATSEAAQAITEHLQLSSLDPDSGTLGFAPTCNLAVPAELAAGLPFDESFPLAAGEDREWCVRAAAAGHAPRYHPGALVDHHHELTLGGFLRQQYRYGRGAARLRLPSRDGSHPAVPAVHRARPRFYIGLVRAGFARGTRVGTLVVLAQVAAAAGFAAELASRRRP
jgi:glycosyltransferase involved in cell wall biosynthesis